MKQETLPNCLLILGCGYVGEKLAAFCLQQGMKIKATARNPAQVTALQQMGIDAVCQEEPARLSKAWLTDCDALLDSIPLAYDQAPCQTQSQWISPLVSSMPELSWAGYLSSTGVYGDSQGQWLDETSAHYSDSKRGLERLKAEQAWLNSSAPAEVFRLAGIYGNERNILGKLMAGNYKTVAWNPARYSNRIHVDDIVTTLFAAMKNPRPGRIINLCDDEPCSHHEYCSELAELIGAPLPVILSPEEAERQLSPAYLDFFRENKRISNRKLHDELLPDLKYPGFRQAAPYLKIN